MHLPDDAPLPPIPPRDPRGHKGTFGTVCVVGGCAGPSSVMIGAPALAATSAMRAGCGRCTLAAPKPVAAHCVSMCPTATGLALPTNAKGELDASACVPLLDERLGASDCVVIGPGLGLSGGAAGLVLRCLVQETCPVVVDADALTLLARTPEAHRDLRAPTVLTPHPGEFDRLAASVGMGTCDPSAESAADLARRLGVVVLLKGSATHVTDGQRVWTHDAPNPALASGGTGDVLAGILGGLIAQLHRTPLIAGERTLTSEARGGLGLYDIARLATTLHARAARLWAQHTSSADAGMLATDLAGLIPEARAAMRSALA